MLHESALGMFRDSPLGVFRWPFWLAKGKAVLKHNIASRYRCDPAVLPYNTDVLEWLTAQRASGRKIILCTASDRTIAESIARHLGIFDEVLASDGLHNMAGNHKASVLEERFGRFGFDYVGNSRVDLAVWKCARRAVVVGAPDGLAREAAKVCELECVFPSVPSGFLDWCRVFRVHQWLKNLLLFVPMLAAHQLGSADAWAAVSLAFVSFGLCASAVYIANDLLDLDSDRRHPRKRNRPFASGKVQAWAGCLLVPALVAVSVWLGTFIEGDFLGWLSGYFLLTCAYSWGLKRLLLVDCLALAMLYTIRIIAGGAAVGHGVSFWLLAFSVFLFLSLAFVKRYAELELQELRGETLVHGRGYHTADAPLIQTMGITSGYASVLVLALYINSEAVLRLYRAPEFVWGAVPVLLFWISWLWMQAHRGRMHDDPLIFAIKDRASLAAGAAFAAVVVVGATGWPW